MWSTLLLCLVVFYILKKWWTSRKERGDLDLIPGPKSSPWWVLLRPGNKDHEIPHLIMTDLAKKYGPIFNVRQLNGDDFVVINSYDLIYQVLVTNGKDFGGRSELFRLKAAFGQTGILQNSEPDEKWRLLRRISQRHLRMFGDGLSRLENIIIFVAEEMFGKFAENEGKPYNPKEPTNDAAMNSIAFLISGQQSTGEDPLVQKMRLYDNLARHVLTSATLLSFHLLDALPWLRFFGISSWKQIQHLRSVETKVWREIVDVNSANPESQSICKVFQEYMKSSDGQEKSVTLNEARKTSLTLLFAGVITTSSTLYGAINILAHHPEIQEKLLKEIDATVQEGEGIKLPDRSRMHYCRAVIYEVLRYHSQTPLSVVHRTCRDTKLGGYSIPAGTRVVTALYLLHHDEVFWGDPYTFRPERFLDEDGELLPADHPNRKHLMPFGAGTRVCLGESLALTRLFLWITNLVQKYKVTPAPGNLKSSCDPRGYKLYGVLCPPDYEIIFTKRE